MAEARCETWDGGQPRLWPSNENMVRDVNIGARRYGVLAAVIGLVAWAGTACAWDRVITLDTGAITVRCDEAVTPAEATAVVLGDTLRINYRLPDNGNGVFVRAARLIRQDLPEEPWGIELRMPRPARDIALRVFLTDDGGEMWEYGIPRVPDWNTHAALRIEIPFAWFTIVPWERRDGRFDPASLSSVTVRLSNADPRHAREGTLELTRITLLDRRRDVTSTSSGAFALVDLAHAFNADGVAYRDNPLDGDFLTGDWQHRTFPAEHFPTDAVATFARVPFRMPDVADGRDNHVRCNGQRLAGIAPGHYAAMYALVTGKFGAQMGDLVLHYDDGSAERVLLDVSDWSDGPVRGDLTAIRFPEAYHEHAIEDRQPKLYVQSIRVNPSKTLQYIDLPVNDSIRVFALTLATGDAPTAGAMQSQSLVDVYPRYAMRSLDELTFDAPVRGVGVYGAYLRTSKGQWRMDEPTTNGTLAFTLDVGRLASRSPSIPLVWTGYRGMDAPLTLGQFIFPGATFAAPESNLLDWTCIQYTTQTREEERDTLEVLLSRAWPAMRLETSRTSVHWLIGDGHAASGMAYATPEGVSAWRVDAHPIADMAEPWILTWATHSETNIAVPMLLVFENRPISLGLERFEERRSLLTVAFSERAGGVCVMPLHGIVPVAADDAAGWIHDGVPDAIAEACRQWARRLQRFPVAVAEAATIEAGENEVRLTSTWRFRGWDNAWNVEPEPVALIPPVLSFARGKGHDARIVSPVLESNYTTFWGPAALVAGDMTEVTLSVPRYVASAPIPARVSGAPLLDAITEELRDAIAAAIPSSIHRFAATGDEARLRVLAPSHLPLGVPVQGVRDYARGVAENLLAATTLKVEKEPISNQFYLMDDRFWAKDEVFDKEWQIGYILQGLWSYAYHCGDAELLERHWGRIKGLYAYYQLIFDWATMSTYTMATGFNANSDGIRIAWEGMIAMARMAAMVGDEALHADATVRASKQMLSLYASWYAPQWAVDHDYAMVQYRPILGDEAELRFAPDNSWTEYFTCNLSHPTDFFQTTHAFFAFNLSHLAFLHDSGIGERFLRPWLNEVVPRLHPRWFDGNATEATGRYYGGDHTMAHLMARALVLGDTTEELYRYYERSVRDTHVSTQWYRPQTLAPETLTAMLMGAAPLVYAPVLNAQVVENTYDAHTKKHLIRLRGTRGTIARVVIRVGDRSVGRVGIDGAVCDAIFDPESNELSVPVTLEAQQESILEIVYV